MFITGASRGIGKEIALKLAKDGANIVVAAKTATAHPKLPGTIYTAAEEIEKVSHWGKMQTRSTEKFVRNSYRHTCKPDRHGSTRSSLKTQCYELKNIPKCRSQRVLRTGWLFVNVPRAGLEMEIYTLV